MMAQQIQARGKSAGLETEPRWLGLGHAGQKAYLRQATLGWDLCTHCLFLGVFPFSKFQLFCLLQSLGLDLW